MAQSFWEKLGWFALRKAVKEILAKRKSKQEKTPENPKQDPTNDNKSHPWRLCPRGEHWVVTHPLTVPVSEKNPDGQTTRHAHCRTNPGRQEYLRPEEIHEIATRYAAQATPKPTPDALDTPDGNKYDDLIALWTQFWNEVFQPDLPLDPNLVKALMYSENKFRLKGDGNNKASIGKARGLIQITDETRRILQDPKGELKDYLIPLDQIEVYDPNLNVAAGVRWLFQKRALLNSRKNLKREKGSASWETTVLEYKGITDQIPKNDPKARRIKEEFEWAYDRLRKMGEQK